jgi:hypothetical protein
MSLRRSLLVTAALAAVALSLAACGSSGSPSNANGATKRSDGLAFAQCMRTHGVPNFPDPTIGAGGIYSFSLPPGLDLRSEQSQAAQQACRSLLFGGGGSQAQQQEATAAALAVARCMRAHGIKDYPDPTAQGDIQIASKPGSDLDPNSPLFRAANAACAHLMPSPQGGMTLSQGRSGGASGSR